MDEFKDKEILLAIGNTGAGKSTLLGAMLNGAESLKAFENKDIFYKKKPDGSQKRIVIRRNVIVYKDEANDGPFPICHSKT